MGTKSLGWTNRNRRPRVRCHRSTNACCFQATPVVCGDRIGRIALTIVAVSVTKVRLRSDAGRFRQQEVSDLEPTPTRRDHPCGLKIGTENPRIACFRGERRLVDRNLVFILVSAVPANGLVLETGGRHPNHPADS
jgi:hypothetical protein